MYKRARAPRISLGSLLVTFLLGVMIGGGVVYAILGDNTPGVEPPALSTAAAPEVPPVENAANTPAVDTPAIDTPVAPGAPVEAPPEPAPEPEPDESVPLRGARFLFISTRGAALDEETRSFLEVFQPGGVVLLGHNIENRAQTIAYVEAIKQAAGMGTGLADLPLIAVDQEGGTVNRLKLREAPSAAELGNGGDLGRVLAAAENAAEACRSRGIAINLAPVLDIADPAGPPGFARRSFADDSAAVTELGLAFAQGLMSGGVIPVAKHYPGHGSTTADSHDGPALLEHPVEQLAHIMYPFAEAVASGAPGVMAGHISVTQLDAGVPASLSAKLLTQVLRERWAYDGVIVSDDLAMKAITDRYTLEEAAVRALQAGCDAVIVSEPDFATLERIAVAIERAVERGILNEDSLRKSQVRLEGWQTW